MLKRPFSVVFLLILLVTLATPAAAQNPPGTAGGLTVPVSGTARSAGRVVGTFTVTEFVPLNGGLGAAGKLAVTTARGDTLVSNVVMPVSSITTQAGAAAAAIGPVLQQATTCEILDLVLGPLDLNLAGLEVHLDTVHLLITADPTGGLLGSLLSSLLCGSAGSTLATLLQNLVGNLQQIITILNNILAALG